MTSVVGGLLSLPSQGTGQGNVNGAEQNEKTQGDQQTESATSTDTTNQSSTTESKATQPVSAPEASVATLNSEPTRANAQSLIIAVSEAPAQDTSLADARAAAEAYSRDYASTAILEQLSTPVSAPDMDVIKAESVPNEDQAGSEGDPFGGGNDAASQARESRI